MPTLVASTGCQRQQRNWPTLILSAIKSSSKAPRLQGCVSSEGGWHASVAFTGLPLEVPGKMLHLQRNGSSKAGKKEQTLFAVSVFTNYLKWILADKNMAVSRNFWKPKHLLSTINRAAVFILTATFCNLNIWFLQSTKPPWYRHLNWSISSTNQLQFLTSWIWIFYKTGRSVMLSFELA